MRGVAHAHDRVLAGVSAAPAQRRRNPVYRDFARGTGEHLGEDGRVAGEDALVDAEDGVLSDDVDVTVREPQVPVTITGLRGSGSRRAGIRKASPSKASLCRAAVSKATLRRRCALFLLIFPTRLGRRAIWKDMHARVSKACEI